MRQKLDIDNINKKVTISYEISDITQITHTSTSYNTAILSSIISKELSWSVKKKSTISPSERYSYLLYAYQKHLK